MATARSRISKGRNFQVQIKKMIQECFQLDDEDIRTPIGSQAGSDIILSRKAKEIIGYVDIECKNQKSISFWAALEQSKKRLKENEVPILVCHRSIQGNSDIWLTCPIQHYLDLRRELLELNKEKNETCNNNVVNKKKLPI